MTRLLGNPSRDFSILNPFFRVENELSGTIIFVVKQLHIIGNNMLIK